MTRGSWMRLGRRAAVNDTAGFENVAIVGGLERRASILLDQQD